MKVRKKLVAALALCAIPAFGCLACGQGKLQEAPSADQERPGVAVMGHVGRSEDAFAAAAGCCEVGNNCGNTSKFTCEQMFGGTYYPGKSCMQFCGPREGCCK